ncbi:ankyrin repeat domain-containing protein [Wolbachia endosymbiont (group B) of Gerris lacustris]|uniref:ankyrin repeat domain-containing protein n=1 Tax=Wolbachia endosymbiont (group B) of Gerris lacustris TaxID=3066159 RepID=UPI0033406D42
MLSRNNVDFGRRVVNDTALRAQNQTTSGQSTTKLFKAIDDENPGDFERALAEGANVNEFDKEGFTPLMSIANSYVASSDGQAALEKMAKLLIQKRIININAQSEQPVYKEEHKRDRFGRLVYLFRGEEVAEVRPSQYIYCSNGQTLNNVDDQGIPIHFNYTYDAVKKSVRTSFIQKDTALHIACQTGAVDIVKRLLTHPDVKADIKNYHNTVPKDLITRGLENTMKLEFEKAQRGRQLLNVLSGKNINEVKRLLSQEFNPNCWKSLNGEIETPLSLIIKSCLQGITQDNEEVLTKLLKHQELDFSQIKPIPAIERNQWVKQIIERAMKERLTDVINRKDLDDVKELVEDNCFINDQIVIEVLENFNPIREYLNEKFPTSAEQPVANTHNVQPEINDEFISQELQRLENLKGELERTKARLTEKEKELNRVVSEKTRDTNKISQLERDLRQERSAQQTRINTLTNQVTQLTREKSQLENLRACS